LRLGGDERIPDEIERGPRETPIRWREITNFSASTLWQKWTARKIAVLESCLNKRGVSRRHLYS